MVKSTSPSLAFEQMPVEKQLHQLYERRLVVDRLIETLEEYGRTHMRQSPEREQSQARVERLAS